VKTRSLALSALFGSIYVVANFLPFSKFIGGAGFVTAGVTILPVIAALLTPLYALIAGIIGGIGISLFGIGLATVFPGFCIYITASTTLLGSIAFHYRKYAWIPAAYIFGQGIMYILWYNFQATGLWLIHYTIGVMIAVIYCVTERGKVALTFTTAICENVGMNIGSLVLLNLPAVLWTFIAPVSIMERVIAGVVSAIILKGIQKILPTMPEVAEL